MYLNVRSRVGKVWYIYLKYVLWFCIIDGDVIYGDINVGRVGVLDVDIGIVYICVSIRSGDYGGCLL